MSKKELKFLINREFGFSIHKIVLLECDYTGKYVMFSVCGIQYQMRFSVMRDEYTLEVYESNYRVKNDMQK